MILNIFINISDSKMSILLNLPFIEIKVYTNCSFNPLGHLNKVNIINKVMID